MPSVIELEVWEASDESVILALKRVLHATQELTRRLPQQCGSYGKERGEDEQQ